MHSFQIPFLFYHVECVTSINHTWIPYAIEPRRSAV
jgi:hypothetical protein